MWSSLMQNQIVPALQRLKPPPADASMQDVQRWRWIIAGACALNAFALAGHIALACGLTGLWAGFAQASDVAQLREAYVKDRISDLELNILDTKEKLCTSTGQARALYAAALSKLLVEYQELKKATFPVPDCSAYGAS